LSGAQPLDKFTAVIDEQLAIAKGLVDKGVARGKVYDELMKTAKAAGEIEKKDVPPPGKDNPFKGAKNAKVVIQQFSDFQCPFCTRVEPTIEQILKEYGDKVQVVWRNMPLPFHQDAKLAAEAAQEAFTQQGSEGFWKYHGTLFANQKSLKREDLEKYAAAQGLNMAKFKKALDDHTHAKVVEADMAIAGKAGVNGTPAFTINGAFLQVSAVLEVARGLLLRVIFFQGASGNRSRVSDARSFQAPQKWIQPQLVANGRTGTMSGHDDRIRLQRHHALLERARQCGAITAPKVRAPDAALKECVTGKYVALTRATGQEAAAARRVPWRVQHGDLDIARVHREAVRQRAEHFALARQG
jgi:protein-disulfide isomerase